MIICLSPRSAYFYEFPPNERTGKKKTTFSRFLKTLKSSKHKDKHTTTSNSNHHNSPKHSNVNSREPARPSRCKIGNSCSDNTDAGTCVAEKSPDFSV
ncbi:hypothetical protein M8J77_006004 [Diaphorina citri]|nr:hypothetical protein M8J77_006004 [Diaphorina citri]